MNVQLLLAGTLALAGAAVHGLGGELLVVRRLSPRALPPSPFGGPSMTKTMIGVTWQMTTIASASLGILEMYAAASGGVDRGVEMLAAGTATAFAALAIGAGRRPGLTVALRHPGPWVLATVAALTWWGAL